ncbi:MAG: membrane protein insertion efficiency factor YidD [Woeseiaceae bacterium]
MSTILLHIISFYQRFISPYKGFRCAAGVYYGTGSCSQVVKSIIEKDGVRHGRFAIKDQFRRCAIAAQRFRIEEKKKKKKPRRRNAGGDAACFLTEAACWSCSMWS